MAGNLLKQGKTESGWVYCKLGQAAVPAVISVSAVVTKLKSANMRIDVRHTVSAAMKVILLKPVLDHSAVCCALRQFLSGRSRNVTSAVGVVKRSETLCRR